MYFIIISFLNCGFKLRGAIDYKLPKKPKDLLPIKVQIKININRGQFIWARLEYDSCDKD